MSYVDEYPVAIISADFGEMAADTPAIVNVIYGDGSTKTFTEDVDVQAVCEQLSAQHKALVAGERIFVNIGTVE